MRHNRRSTGKVAGAQFESATEVVSLIKDDEDDESANPASIAGIPTEADALPPEAAAAQAAKDVVYSMEYEFPSSDDEPAAAATDTNSDSDWEQPKSKQQSGQQAANKQQRRKQQLQDDDVEEDVQEAILQSISKRTSNKRPAGIAAGAMGNAAAAAAGGCKSPAVKQPASKRAKTATKAPTGAAAKRAAPAGTRKGSAARSAGATRQTKQTTLQLVQSKGFGSLCFSASQPAALSQNASQLPASGSQGAPASAASHPAVASQRAAADASLAAAAAVSSTSSQWSDRHEPCSPDELVVHKRKVAEVQAWLQVFLDAQAAGHCPTRVLLVTGPPGCGKSVTLRVLAESMGFELTEWQAPVPTLWQDYQYQAGAGVGYSSKLDEFDLFVARCKFAALPLTCSSSSKPQSSQQQQQSSLTQSQQMPPPKRRLPQLLPHYQRASQQQHGLQQQQQQQQYEGSQQDQQQGQVQAVQHQPSSQAARQQQSPRSRQQPSRQQQQPKQARLKSRSKLLLVDDLPYVGDNARRARLAASLADLAATARCPVVIVATTEEGGSGSSNYSSYGAAAAGMTTKGLHKDLLAVLEHAGATTINFNPITGNTITKALQTIADKEGFALDPDTAAGIAQAAAGDLRNAIQSLQMLLLQQQPAAVQPARKGKAKAPRKPRRNTRDPEAVAAAAAAKQKVAGQVARDQHLSVYHAIGKLLHHKRQVPEQQQQPGQPGSQQQQQQQQQPPQEDSDVEVIDAAAPDAVTTLQQVTSRLWRPPLQVQPEAIIQGSGLEALQVTAFLAENYPHFFAEDAMEQAATAAAYLSDAGYLACHRSPVVSSSAGFWSEDDTAATTLQASAASSIAARGLLFANTHPAPSRWLPLRGPSCFAPDKAAAGNLQRLGEAVQQLQDNWHAAGPAKQQAVVGLAGQLLHSGRQERAAQVLPYLQLLARQQSRVWIHSMLPRSWYHVWNGAVTEQSSSQIQQPQASAALQAAVLAALVDRGGWPACSQRTGVEAADDESLVMSEEIESDDC